MVFEPFESEREITVAIRKVTNGYVLRMYRPPKPYESRSGHWESKEMVFVGLEPCLDFVRKFLQNPWETQVGQ
jgi:hypothetical protein